MKNVLNYFFCLFVTTEPLDDDEEILLAIAAELSRFIPLVGGAAHAHTILPPLEALAQTEETVVREQAVESICSVGTAMSVAQLEEHVVPMVQVCGVPLLDLYYYH